MLLANVNRAGKTVAVENELVYRRRRFPGGAVRSISGKKCFSCVGEDFALDRCLLMGDPDAKAARENPYRVSSSSRKCGAFNPLVLRTGWLGCPGHPRTAGFLYSVDCNHREWHIYDPKKY